MLRMSGRGAEPASAVWADERSHKGGRGTGGTGAASVQAPPMQCLEVHWLNALQVATRDRYMHGRSPRRKKWQKQAWLVGLASPGGLPPTGCQVAPS